jgi:hypothetical protein
MGFAGWTIEFVKPLLKCLVASGCLDCRLNWPSPPMGKQGLGGGNAHKYLS